jgi:hypothetical protein
MIRARFLAALKMLFHGFWVPLAARATAMKVVVPKAPWSAVALATAFSLGIQGGSFAAAVQGASRIFMQCGEPKDHEICPRNDSVQKGFRSW